MMFIYEYLKVKRVKYKYLCMINMLLHQSFVLYIDKKNDKPPKRNKNIFYRLLVHHIQHIRHVDVLIDI